MPMLYLWSDFEKKRRKEVGIDSVELWRKVYPNLTDVGIPNCWHFLNEENPEPVNRELLAFLHEGARMSSSYSGS